MGEESMELMERMLVEKMFQTDSFVVFVTAVAVAAGFSVLFVEQLSWGEIQGPAVIAAAVAAAVPQGAEKDIEVLPIHSEQH